MGTIVRQAEKVCFSLFTEFLPLFDHIPKFYSTIFSVHCPFHFKNHLIWQKFDKK